MQDLVDINKSSEDMAAEVKQKFSLNQQKAEQVRTKCDDKSDVFLS